MASINITRTHLIFAVVAVVTVVLFYQMTRVQSHIVIRGNSGLNEFKNVYLAIFCQLITESPPDLSIKFCSKQKC